MYCMCAISNYEIGDMPTECVKCYATKPGICSQNVQSVPTAYWRVYGVLYYEIWDMECIVCVPFENMKSGICLQCKVLYH